MKILQPYYFHTMPTWKETPERFLVVCRDWSGFKQVYEMKTKKEATEKAKYYRWLFRYDDEYKTHIFKIR